MFADDPALIPPKKHKKKTNSLTENLDEEFVRKPHLIYPSECWKVVFDMFISLLLVYSCNVVPIQLAFADDMLG